MNLGKELKKAMVDKGVSGAKQLSELSGISYGKTIRALNGDNSSRLVDVVTIANCLGVSLKFISNGE